MLRHISVFFASLAFLLTASAVSAQAIDIGEATREGDGIVSIRIVSADSNVARLAQRAFSTHGGFRVVTSGEASVTATITPSGNSVSLDLRTRTNQATRSFTGENLRDSVMRACDAVVTAIYQTPGYFASRIVFVGKQRGATELFTSDLFFNQVRPITSDRSLVVSPRWSPDGSRIVYTSYHASGFPDIFTIDFNSGRRTALATFRGTNTGASFSPDGRRIAMALSGTGNSELFVINSDATNLRRLTNNRSLESSPSWSPDGTRLVFTSDAPGRPQLHEMPANGGAMRRIPTNISGYCAEPHWNPRNGNLIAFTAAVGGGFQIAVYNASTRSSAFVTQVRDAAVEPHWLNDGRHLIFTERRDGAKRLVLLDTVTRRTSELHAPSFGDASMASAVYPRR